MAVAKLLGRIDGRTANTQCQIVLLRLKYFVFVSRSNVGFGFKAVQVSLSLTAFVRS